MGKKRGFLGGINPKVGPPKTKGKGVPQKKKWALKSLERNNQLNPPQKNWKGKEKSWERKKKSPPNSLGNPLNSFKKLKFNCEIFWKRLLEFNP